MQNMNTYTLGHGTSLTTTNWSPISQPAFYMPPYNADIAKLLNSLFQGKVCIYIDKLSRKQKILSKPAAELYIGTFYPSTLCEPFDLNGNLREGIYIEKIYFWFAAEDGFSKFKFRYPMNDQEKEQAIDTIAPTQKFFISSGFHTTTNVSGPPVIYTGIAS